MKLSSWVRVANGYYETAKLLEDPRLAVNNAKADTIGSSWYLLHLSLELYLKAFLIHQNKYSKENSKTHNLDYLVKQLEGQSKVLDECLDEIIEGKPVRSWLHFVNPFGFPNGGIRYLQNKKNMYAAPLGMSYFFVKLVMIIAAECNIDDQEISEII